MKHLIIILATFVTLTGCSSTNEINKSEPNNQELLISVATSLTEVLQEIVELYEMENPHTTITLNIGSSGTLARQIQQGAPADIFLSADEPSMDLLDDQGLLVSDTRIDFTKNQLILIGDQDSSIEVNSLEELMEYDIDQIAIGNPDSVPAGSYTKSALENSGIWNHSRLQNKLIYAKDVRQVLTYVTSGNAEIGFVYYTDVLLSDQVKQLLSINEDLHEPITYPGSVIATSEQREIANDFLLFLKQEKATQLFKKYGFTSLKVD
ncbi:molybdate ABC transporter substrate-binding protein [Ornithinibacillus sp. L9]|uniref:Molybdate ABC transporter substrate-binding protein n=1 Tax=Ornithinibacillus caprae TaxID=2678566 RepID=A0A6N8FIQ3_9BACI|nr:molybdate ABC transporter substrate-binding protein [Ornithinibacillus caprae]MUK88154.1 molybdate ABC transporter substrate-binding protein [Ornithinibacillus caprae]